MVGAGQHREKYYTAWCDLLAFHVRKRGWSMAGFAKMVRQDQSKVYQYSIGRIRPPLALVPLWAVSPLGLRGPERHQFVWAAFEAHTPPEVWKRLQDLEAGIALPQPVVPKTIPPEVVQLLMDIRDAIWPAGNRIPGGWENARETREAIHSRLLEILANA